MLRPWQETSVQHLLGCLSRHGAAADLSDPGTGKTYTATALAKELNRPTLVVCPKAVIPVWHRVASFLGTEFDVLNYEMVRTGRTPYAGWKRESRQRKDRFHWNSGIELLILDECHRCGSINSLQAEMLLAAKRQGIKTLLLSATLADSPLEMRAAGYALGLHNDQDAPTLRNPTPLSFHSWARRHGCGPGAFSQFEFNGNAAKKAAHMAKIHAAILPDKGVRVRIADLGDAFPETQITAELYEIKEKARVDALYAQMREALDDLKGRTAAYADTPLSRLLKARQELELIKVPIAVELAQDALAQGMSVPIFVNFRATVEELCARLGTRCRVDGSQTGDAGARERAACVDAFQADQERVIVCNNDAGGVGLSLHDLHGNHPRQSLIFPGYSAKTFRQVTGRVHRADGKSKSLQRAILLAGTEEEKIARALERKLTCLDALNDCDFTP